MAQPTRKQHDDTPHPILRNGPPSCTSDSGSKADASDTPERVHTRQDPVQGHIWPGQNSASQPTALTSPGSAGVMERHLMLHFHRGRVTSIDDDLLQRERCQVSPNVPAPHESDSHQPFLLEQTHRQPYGERGLQSSYLL